MEDLADLLYGFLPGSGNARTAFPLAAATVQADDLWVGGSKRPAIVHLLSAVLGERRHRFGLLIVAIVRQSMTWRRGRGEPLTRDEIERLNKILLRLSIKIPELNEQGFLDSLDHSATRREDAEPQGYAQPSDGVAKELSQRLIGLYDHPPQRRGYEYERVKRLPTMTPGRPALSHWFRDLNADLRELRPAHLVTPSTLVLSIASQCFSGLFKGVNVGSRFTFSYQTERGSFDRATKCGNFGS